MLTEGLNPTNTNEKMTPHLLAGVRHPRITQRRVYKWIEDHEGRKHIAWERVEVRRNYNDSEKRNRSSDYSSGDPEVHLVQGCAIGGSGGCEYGHQDDE